MSIYQLKPRFQALLRPVVATLAKAGVTANQVTLFACFVSVAIGIGLVVFQSPRGAFVLLPIWMFLRMALNAIDGMLAREHQQQSKLGAILNELTDVVSDAALFLPFAFVAPLEPLLIALIIALSSISEFAGVLGQTIGASRRYDGPMGKSDRAFVFGVLGLVVSMMAATPIWVNWLLGLVAGLILLTTHNRIQMALKEANTQHG